MKVDNTRAASSALLMCPASPPSAAAEAGKGQNTNLLLKLLKVGNVGVLEAFRTFIYDGQVNGVSDGIRLSPMIPPQRACLTRSVTPVRPVASAVD